jgi:hypothetical protein
MNLNLAGTGLMVLTSVAAAVHPDAFAPLHAGLSGVAFVIGTAALLWAFVLGIGRSRDELIAVGGLFFLAGGSAPAPVARRFWVALTVQLVAVVAAASVRPFTVVAFGVLAPMLGMGLMAAWGARHGTFPKRGSG